MFLEYLLPSGGQDGVQNWILCSILSTSALNSHNKHLVSDNIFNSPIHFFGMQN